MGRGPWGWNFLSRDQILKRKQFACDYNVDGKGRGSLVLRLIFKDHHTDNIMRNAQAEHEAKMEILKLKKELNIAKISYIDDKSKARAGGRGSV